MSQYHKLYTPQDSAVVFIDHQPQMTFGVANMDRATLINNVTLMPHHQHDATCHEHGCTHALQQLFTAAGAARNRYAGFFGLGCDCFAF